MCQSWPAPLTGVEGVRPQVPAAQSFELQRAQLGDERCAAHCRPVVREQAPGLIVVAHALPHVVAALRMARTNAIKTSSEMPSQWRTALPPDAGYWLMRPVTVHHNQADQDAKTSIMLLLCYRSTYFRHKTRGMYRLPPCTACWTTGFASTVWALVTGNSTSTTGCSQQSTRSQHNASPFAWPWELHLVLATWTAQALVIHNSITPAASHAPNDERTIAWVGLTQGHGISRRSAAPAAPRSPSRCRGAPSTRAGSATSACRPHCRRPGQTAARSGRSPTATRAPCWARPGAGHSHCQARSAHAMRADPTKRWTNQRNPLMHCSLAAKL